MNGTGAVTCSRDVRIVPDVALADVAAAAFEVVVLPGGLGGANAFAASNAVKDILQRQEASGKLIAAM